MTLPHRTVWYAACGRDRILRKDSTMRYDLATTNRKPEATPKPIPKKYNGDWRRVKLSKLRAMIGNIPITPTQDEIRHSNLSVSEGNWTYHLIECIPP